MSLLEAAEASAATGESLAEAMAASVFDQSFTSLATALSFFDDEVLDFGPANAGVSGPLDLQMFFTYTSDTVGDSFALNFVGTSIPEPTSALFVSCGFALLAGLPPITPSLKPSRNQRVENIARCQVGPLSRWMMSMNYRRTFLAKLLLGSLGLGGVAERASADDKYHPRLAEFIAEGIRCFAERELS